MRTLAEIQRAQFILQMSANSLLCQPKSQISATQYEFKSTSAIPLRRHVYGEHLTRGFLTTDAAPGGVGKSTQVISDALAMVTNEPLLGIYPEKPLRVWLWNGEDPRDEIERRVAAACSHFRIDETAIGGRLFIDSGRDSPLVIVTEERSGAIIAKPVVAAVKATILENGIDVFIVDPFVTTHGVSENDNTKMAVVASQWAQIAHDTNCAVQIVHHVRKGDGRELSVEDMRGAGSLATTARAVRLLNPMTVEQADAANVKRNDRFSYFSVINGKSNLTARSEHADWRKLISVPMGNGDANPLGRPQDFVGVVTKWDWPSTETLIEDLPEGAMKAILTALGTGDYREHAQANDWAGRAVAQILGYEMDDPTQKTRVRRMLKAWITAGILEVVQRTDIHREVKKYIVVAKPAVPTKH